MSFDLSQIGFFQFHNLIQQRVPFVLLHESVSLQDLYGGVEMLHLERHARAFDFAARPGSGDWSSFAKDTAIILLPQKGDGAQAWARALEAAGFLNVYWVPGGWERLTREARDEI